MGKILNVGWSKGKGKKEVRREVMNEASKENMGGRKGMAGRMDGANELTNKKPKEVRIGYLALFTPSVHIPAIIYTLFNLERISNK